MTSSRDTRTPSEVAALLSAGERLVEAARSLLQARTGLDQHVAALVRAVAVPLEPEARGSPGLTALVLDEHDGPTPLWEGLEALAPLEELSDPLLDIASRITQNVPPLLAVARPAAVGGWRYALRRSSDKQQSLQAVAAVERLLDQARKDGLLLRYDEVVESFRRPPPPARLTARQVVDRAGRELGLRPPAHGPVEVTDPELTAARTVAVHGPAVLERRPRLLSRVRSAFHDVQEAMVDGQLQQLPVDVLKEVTAGRVHFGTLDKAGCRTVADVLVRRADLAQIHGISHQMAEQVFAAAKQVAGAVRDDLRFRIDLDRTDDRVTRLLRAVYLLRRYDDVVQAHAEDLERGVEVLRPFRGIRHTCSAVALVGPGAAAAVEEVHSWGAWAHRSGVATEVARLQRTRAEPTDDDVWDDFEADSAGYFTSLGLVVDLTLDDEAEAGFLPADIVEAVHGQHLDEAALRVSLRGYQSFGARYALVQGRVLLGDEMGLGKTVQAIAVMAHLHAEGHTHFLVVCPASVLINWVREVRTRSTLRAHQAHGSDRAHAWRTWMQRGGVAITTFDTLRSLPGQPETLGLLVVDEAHLIKNPSTRRAQSLLQFTELADRALFMSGTPMENRVEEFRTLVSYLRPDVADRLSVTDGVAGARRFREAVAPVYLRRNQEDVLRELPELVQVDDWEEFSREEQSAYRDAVVDGNFMQMRRVAFVADPRGSSKVTRLRELADEAAENGLKVIVFSYFKEVLEVARAALGPRALGPLTGALSAAKRQQLVDRFTDSPADVVLLSQIQAGGVGLNMQAGSVVVLCEPQVKPSLEAQAVARAHRMGQVRPVQVHRLLVTDSVDQRMLELLDLKQRLFDEYARGSDVAAASPEAIDVSEKQLARDVVAAEQERLAVRLSEQYEAEQA